MQFLTGNGTEGKDQISSMSGPDPLTWRYNSFSKGKKGPSHSLGKLGPLLDTVVSPGFTSSDAHHPYNTLDVVW